MKRLRASLFSAALITFISCNNNQRSGALPPVRETASATQAAVSKEVATSAPLFKTIDSKTAASIRIIFGHYLAIKNALANDNGPQAAEGGKAMSEAIGEWDKSVLTPGQKDIVDAQANDLKENAEHIGKNPDKIGHQREHFSWMSEEIYALIKAFGAGQIVYRDHCPMYKDQKGADWISETISIKNPYLGNKMSSCGQVKEKIQKAF